MTMSTGADGGPGSTRKRQSFIDRESHFNGTHTTTNDLYIEGQFEGSIECAGALIVAEGAEVNAHVLAGSVSVAGHLQGEIGCRERFEMLPTGRVEARVQAGSIVVHEGACYEGEMRMRREGSADSVDDASPARRTDPRPVRRLGAVPSSDLPPFAGNAARANGRPMFEAEGTRAVPERAAPAGQSLTAEA